MTMIQIFVLVMASAGFLTDLLWGTVPNAMLFIGLLSGFVLKLSRTVQFAMITGDFVLVLAAIGIFLAGAAIPFLLGWILFRFRMLGAGDIKLLMVIGGVLGPRLCVRFLIVSVVCGAAISLPLLLGVTGINERIVYFRNYVRKTLLDRKIESYREDKSAEFHYTAAILMTAILYAGGILH